MKSFRQTLVCVNVIWLFDLALQLRKNGIVADKEPEEEHIFPHDLCVSVLKELNAWTSVKAILAAGRDLEDRGLPEDQMEGRLVMPMPHGPLFEAVFLRAISWMVESYRVPDPKILFARTLDSAMADKTLARLRAVRFNPTITSVPLAAFDGDAAQPPTGANAFLVDDEPFVIELVQGPLNCLMDILTFSFGSAEGAHNLQVEARKKTGGSPTIFHRPYADSRLYAMLEALCYYAHGLSIGPFEARDGITEIDVSYRAVNLLCRPPVDAHLASVARNTMEEMLRDLI